MQEWVCLPIGQITRSLLQQIGSKGYKELVSIQHMAKYDGLLGQPVLEVEEPDKEDGITFIFKDNRFLFIKAVGDKIDTVSIPE